MLCTGRITCLAVSQSAYSVGLQAFDIEPNIGMIVFKDRYTCQFSANFGHFCDHFFTRSVLKARIGFLKEGSDLRYKLYVLQPLLF